MTADITVAEVMAAHGKRRAKVRAWLDATADTQRREPGCQCQWEVGDSPCRVHGEEEEEP